MTLSTDIGHAVDKLISKTPDLSTFQKVDVLLGQGIRRYFMETSFAQRELLLIRDKWWTKEGGKVYVWVACLAPTVQMALQDAAQSLRTPDYTGASPNFQFCLTDLGKQASWEVKSKSDVVALIDSLATWLRVSALPWLERLNSMDGVISWLNEQGNHFTLTRLQAALGMNDTARSSLAAWLRTYPREVDRELEQLVQDGILTEEDYSRLRLASIQHRDTYVAQLEAWLGGSR